MGAIDRCRLVVLAALLCFCAVSKADEPTPDPAGDFQMTPTRSSVPNYTLPPIKPPENASAEDKAKYEAAMAEWRNSENLGKNLDAVARRTSANYFSINFVWVLVAGFLVMFMQAGFALMETGLCRAKNAAHTMSMNFVVYALGMTGFFVCGFAFMCGGINGTNIGGASALGGVPTLNQMITIGDGWGILGKTGFFLTGAGYDASVAVWFLFMMVFMDTAATIPTGSCAERWSFKSFFIFSLFVGAFTYPVYGCWVWGGGWLAQLGLKAGLAHGAVDYAGSGVVHLQGGTIALVLSKMLGPRIGKYDSNGNPRPILGHHVPMVMVGTLILAFGWFGFNTGSSLAGTDGRIGLIAVNTMLASGAAILSSCLYMWWTISKPDPSLLCNGMLAGLVAITASCAFVSPLSAFFIGSIAGVLVVWGIFFFEKVRIDDPVGAISVHCLCGLWGLLALGLFADGTYGRSFNGCHLFKLVDGSLQYFNDISKAPAGAIEQGVTGLFYGNGQQLLVQIIDGCVSITWNLIAASAIFWTIGKVLGSNRVPPEVELAGLDIPEMGAPGYPEFLHAVAPEQIPNSEIRAAMMR